MCSWVHTGNVDPQNADYYTTMPSGPKTFSVVDSRTTQSVKPTGVEWDNNHKVGISYKEQIVAHPGIFQEGMRGTTKTLTCRVVGRDAETSRTQGYSVTTPSSSHYNIIKQTCSKTPRRTIEFVVCTSIPVGIWGNGSTRKRKMGRIWRHSSATELVLRWSHTERDKWIF